MKWQDIVNITPEQFNRMNKEELKAATQILASAGNKRLKRAQEQGFESASITAVMKKGKFSTKDKSMNQLRNEFMRAKRFLESKTGTLSEFNKFRKRSIEGLKKQGINITPEQFTNFWKAYEKLRKDNPKIAEKGLKYIILDEVNDMQRDNAEIDVDTIVTALQNELSATEEANEATTRQAEETAKEIDFFEQLPEVKTRKEVTTGNEATDRSAARAARTKARRRR